MENMERQTISVIMLTYNREDLISRMIKCILAQTHRSFEFIIVDNGSTDRSGIIADEYAAQDKRIRVIRKERGNIGSGRNAGLDAATGEWIAFVDDDDYCESDFLAFTYKLAANNKADIAICSAHGNPGSEKRVMNAEEALETMYWRVYYNNQFPTKLIKRELFNNIRFSTNAKYDDIELMTMIIASANRVVYDGKPKYTFYRHDANNSAWTTKHELLDLETLNEYLDVYRKRTMWLCDKFPGKSEIWRYFEWSFWISMVEKIKRFSLTDCFAQCDIMIDKLLGCRQEFISNDNIQSFEREWVEQYVSTK